MFLKKHPSVYQSTEPFISLSYFNSSLVHRLFWGGGGKRAWYTLFAHVPSSLGNLYTKYFAILKSTEMLFTRQKATLQNYTARVTHTGGFKVGNNITLTVTVCITSFKMIGKLHRKKSYQSLAVAFTYSWNKWTYG